MYDVSECIETVIGACLIIAELLLHAQQGYLRAETFA